MILYISSKVCRSAQPLGEQLETSKVGGRDANPAVLLLQVWSLEKSPHVDATCQGQEVSGDTVSSSEDVQTCVLCLENRKKN